MRLKSVEVDAIVQSARDVFGTGVSVALFGSRVDDAQKGGDIDLADSNLKCNFCNRI